MTTITNCNQLPAGELRMYQFSTEQEAVKFAAYRRAWMLKWKTGVILYLDSRDVL